MARTPAKNHQRAHKTARALTTTLNAQKPYQADGGFIRNIAYLDNEIISASTLGILVETDYQSGGSCNATTCTEIRDIVFRNWTVGIVGNGGGNGNAGNIGCYANRPCQNFTFQDIFTNTTGGWLCRNLSSGSFSNIHPPGLQEACGL